METLKDNPLQCAIKNFRDEREKSRRLLPKLSEVAYGSCW